jgi:integrase
MFTGLRIGEICALKWSDVDLENGILHISKTAMRIQTPTEKSKTAVKITAPKTANSIRDIPLPNFLVKKLSAVMKSDDCYVLSGNSHLVEPRCLSYRFKSILKKANLPSIKFHALRHTFATNCLQKNFDIKTLSEILGHSSVDTTMRIYVHTSLERKRECMDLIRPLI